MILLDTGVIIAGVHTLPESLHEDPVALSTISLAELQFGIEVAGSDEQAFRRRRLYRVKSLGLDWLPFDESAAESYGLLAAAVHRQRRAHSRSKDILIAGHAHSLGARLATLHPHAFELVADYLEIIDVS